MTVDCEIVEEPVSALEEYGQIPITYDVRSVFDVRVVDSGLGGFSLVERTLEEPYTKDYDALRDGGPAQWAAKWDLSQWGVISAVAAGQRVGGCVLACKTNGLDLLEGKHDIAVLWDLRVDPDHRGSGIGTRLVAAATEWAKKRACRLLKVETQNVNVPACRFYAARGFVLGRVDCFAYAELPDEVQLIWHKTL